MLQCPTTPAFLTVERFQYAPLYKKQLFNWRNKSMETTLTMSLIFQSILVTSEIHHSHHHYEKDRMTEIQTFDPWRCEDMKHMLYPLHHKAPLFLWMLIFFFAQIWQTISQLLWRELIMQLIKLGLNFKHERSFSLVRHFNKRTSKYTYLNGQESSDGRAGA